MTFENAVSLLREFGFPVFVACWFMWRLEKRMDRLAELMTSLMQATALLAKSIDNQTVELRDVRSRTSPFGYAPVQQGEVVQKP